LETSSAKLFAIQVERKKSFCAATARRARDQLRLEELLALDADGRPTKRWPSSMPMVRRGLLDVVVVAALTRM